MRGKSFRDPGFAQEGNHPAVCVTWTDAKAYVAWLSKKTSKGYRLLSEAEWEYAARGVTTAAAPSMRWPLGDDVGSLCEYANHAEQSTKLSWRNTACDDGVGETTAEVGSFKANWFGLHDMHGNAYELTEDCRNGYQGAATEGTAFSPDICKLRIPRGGSWNSGPDYLRSAVRAGASPDARSNEIGFRVARPLR